MKKLILGSLCIMLFAFCFITPVHANDKCAAPDIAGIIPDRTACDNFMDLMDKIYNSNTAPNLWYAQTPSQFSQKVLNDKNPDEIFGERYTFAQVNWIINSLLTMINPVAGAQSPTDVLKFLDTVRKVFAYDPNYEPTLADHLKLGPYGIMAAGMKYIYTHPIASGVQETKKSLVSLIDLPVSTAQAQGIGYAKLGQGNVKELWLAMRNISFLLTALLLIASGFMVMFRTQVSPQTVVSIQMIIPKLIMSLILIAFSYAIVGFVLDMVYVVITGFLGLLQFASPTLFGAGGANPAIAALTGNFNFVWHFLGTPLIIAIILGLLVIFLPLIIAILALPTIDIAAPAWIAALMPIAIFVFGLFAWSIYVTARIIGQLLLAYLNIALLTISGPLEIMADIIPVKKSFGFMHWFKCVVGNASVFVTYAVLAIIGEALFNFDWSNTLGFNTDISILKPGFGLPMAYFGGIGESSIAGVILWLLIGMGYFTIVPNIVSGVKDVFCKGEDQSRFIENLVKDTIGQITKAGSEAGSGVRKAGDEAGGQAGGQAGTGGPPNTAGTTATGGTGTTP